MSHWPIATGGTIGVALSTSAFLTIALLTGDPAFLLLAGSYAIGGLCGVGLVVGLVHAACRVRVRRLTGRWRPRPGRYLVAYAWSTRAIVWRTGFVTSRTYVYAALSVDNPVGAFRLWDLLTREV